MNENKLSLALQHYLKQNIRADKALDHISVLIQEIQDKASILQKEIQKPKQTITVLKWLMIFHKLICQRTCPLQILSDLFFQLENKPANDFDQMLTIKLIKPYNLYLQKRLITNFADLDGEIKVFSITNMILRALSFVDILYTFGRYYTQQYPFFIDFNILMGIDIHILYEELYMNINKNNKEILLEEIQKMHQKMYVVYYNCYFYKYLKPYVPRWILTDNGSLSSSKSLNKTTSSLNFSSKSKKYQPTELMAQSMIINGFNKEQDELRLQAIKSMERIVSLFQ